MNTRKVSRGINRPVALLAAALLSISSVGSLAGDHDRAKTLREAGDILPLQQIIERANRDQPGHIVEAELERKQDTYVYEIKILDAEGRLHELYYDARTASPVERQSMRRN